jgi:DNA-binding MarR family transcriptional regulator
MTSTVHVGAPATIDPAEPLDDADRIEALMLRLRRAMQQSPSDWGELDLTLPQLRALWVVRSSGSITIGGIAAATGASLASASALVDRLVRIELVTRREDPSDRRQTLVELSDAGQDLLARVERRHREHLRRSLARMSPDGRSALRFALEDLARAFEEAGS